MKKCYFCKGILKNEKNRHFHQWHGEVIVFENLEVEKCSQCGEVFLSPYTLKLIDRKTEEVLVKNFPHTNVSLPVVVAE